jgi:ATP-dependent Zn protease
MSFSRAVRAGFNSLQLLIWNFSFWIGILLVVVVVLKIIFASPTQRREFDHSELLREIDAGNIQEAKFVRSKDGIEIDGAIRNPHGDFKAAIAEREVDDLTARLRAKGVSAPVADEIPRGSLGYYATFGLLILFFAVWFFLVRFQIKRLKRKALEFRNKDVG